MTYKHILQRVLGEPAVEKHGNEEMPKGWKEDLQKRDEKTEDNAEVLRDERDGWRLTVNKNGTVVTSSRMKWKERICCQMLP